MKKGNTMAQKNRNPKLPVNKKEAMDHALLTIRRAWAGDVRDFKKWGGYDLNAKPLTIYDLNGQVLFYEFDVMDGNKVIGSTKTAASKTIGSPVITMEFGERSWDEKKAIKEAEKKVKKQFPKATFTGNELVCYSYPKIGIRIYFKTADNKEKNLIFDIATLDLVERYASDKIDDFACWSFYETIVEPEIDTRVSNFKLAEKELKAVKAKSAKVLEHGISSRKLNDLKADLIPKPDIDFTPSNTLISWYSSKTISFSPRCNTHECFELYAQETNVYCAVATGQMILDFYRYFNTQDQIAAAMGTGAGGTSNTGQVNGYESISNNCLNATYDSTANWYEARNEINENRPLKSGISGHARACAGWKKQNIYIIGQTPKKWLKIYDPWPWNANICNGGKVYWENWDAINHTNFIYIRHRTQPC